MEDVLDSKTNNSSQKSKRHPIVDEIAALLKKDSNGQLIFSKPAKLLASKLKLVKDEDEIYSVLLSLVALGKHLDVECNSKQAAMEVLEIITSIAPALKVLKSTNADWDSAKKFISETKSQKQGLNAGLKAQSTGFGFSLRK